MTVAGLATFHADPHPSSSVAHIRSRARSCRPTARYRCGSYPRPPWHPCCSSCTTPPPQAPLSPSRATPGGPGLACRDGICRPPGLGDPFNTFLALRSRCSGHPRPPIQLRPPASASPSSSLWAKTNSPPCSPSPSAYATSPTPVSKTRPMSRRASPSAAHAPPRTSPVVTTHVWPTTLIDYQTDNLKS
jgi:hypothetical protein